MEIVKCITLLLLKCPNSSIHDFYELQQQRGETAREREKQLILTKSNECLNIRNFVCEPWWIYELTLSPIWWEYKIICLCERIWPSSVLNSTAISSIFSLENERQYCFIDTKWLCLDFVVVFYTFYVIRTALSPSIKRDTFAHIHTTHKIKFPRSLPVEFVHFLPLGSLHNDSKTGNHEDLLILSIFCEILSRFAPFVSWLNVIYCWQFHMGYL